ncbi:hypothetical protein OSB04_009504, partial [Centaurea solstitialis]
MLKDEMARGDNPKSIQCYMHESGATKTKLETWKKLNKEVEGVAGAQFLQKFVHCATNLARMAQYIYGEGDGHGRPHMTTVTQNSRSQPNLHDSEM